MNMCLYIDVSPLNAAVPTGHGHKATRLHHSGAERALAAGTMTHRLQASHPCLLVSTRPSADIPLRTVS